MIVYYLKTYSNTYSNTMSKSTPTHWSSILLISLLLLDSTPLAQPLHLRLRAAQSFNSSQASILVSAFLSNDILAGSGGATIRASLERLLAGLKEEEVELELKEGKKVNGSEEKSKKRKQSENGGGSNGKEESNKRKKSKGGN